jgi:hypothetical protein
MPDLAQVALHAEEWGLPAPSLLTWIGVVLLVLFGLMLTLGVGGVVAAAGAVVSRRGSRSMGISMLWSRPREGHLEAEVLVPKGSTRVPSDRFSAKVRAPALALTDVSGSYS